MKVVVTAYIDQEHALKLDELCKEKGWSRSKAIAEAVALMVDDFEPEELPNGYKRSTTGVLLKRIKTKLGRVAWKEVTDFDE